MREEHIRLKAKILHILQGANNELKMLESKLKTTSLLKIHLVEKIYHVGLIFQKKKSKKSQKIMPNKPLVSWFESVLLEIHEEYQKALELSHKLCEFGPETTKKLTNLMQLCFTCHLHLSNIDKENLPHFEKHLGCKPNSITLREAERIFEETLYDLRILKEEILGELEIECKSQADLIYA